MTAEIAILNRSAVALASDSAVTIDTPTGPKIYEGANKIFALVKGRPVGVMIFDSADHVGVPWETIIKAYRMDRREAHFAKLEEYASDFLHFVATEKDVTRPNFTMPTSKTWLPSELVASLMRRARKLANISGRGRA